MPVLAIPKTWPSQNVVAALEQLEAEGNRITSQGDGGDALIVVYEPKPRVGRPPKQETR